MLSSTVFYTPDPVELAVFGVIDLSVVGVEAHAAEAGTVAAVEGTTELIASGTARGAESALAGASQAALRAAEDPAAIFIKQKHLLSTRGNQARFVTDDISEVQGWVAEGLQSNGVQVRPNGLDD